jgi:BASS family bile acid:Na+ symporter
MLERWLLVWLVLLSALAYGWPDLVPGFGDPFLVTKPALDVLFAFTMLMIGSLLPIDEVRQVRQRWPAVLGGTVVQYLTMPTLAFIVGRLSGLSGDLLVGVTVVGCVPGALASNVLTLAARGNVSYSVSLTTLSTILSPLVVPVALWATLGEARSPDPRGVSIHLAWTVVIPVIVGHLLSRRFPRWQGITRVIGPPLANGIILWIIAVVVAATRSQLGEALGSLALVLLTLNLLGYGAGYLAARGMHLPGSMTRALTLEIGMQNAGMGTILATQFFPDNPSTAIPTAAYTFGCMLTGSVLAKLWALSREGGELCEAKAKEN